MNRESAPAAGGVVRHLDARGDLRLGRLPLLVWITGSSPSTCCHSNDFFAAVDVEALAVLPGRVEQAAGHLGARRPSPAILNVAVSIANGLPYFGISSSRMRPGAVADDALGVLARGAPGTG